MLRSYTVHYIRTWLNYCQKLIHLQIYVAELSTCLEKDMPQRRGLLDRYTEFKDKFTYAVSLLCSIGTVIIRCRSMTPFSVYSMKQVSASFSLNCNIDNKWRTEEIYVLPPFSCFMVSVIIRDHYRIIHLRHDQGKKGLDDIIMISEYS